ncbi:hypothetical protein CNMCM5793_007385 [Aspergillus hiratsukae]|uniref:Uncharacterized protein n=1 Tax=Aspergillus hiratsukae TaxID=1194566 RepID=A0A8H6QGG7_9EURO|nr:hypothetical protein CNMCM5793_007385 [Aspergillus hiratsukae]KAF7172224.1 hypothetical protein CNMCM6106_006483 [Aspergillus hiratsukae]
MRKSDHPCMTLPDHGEQTAFEWFVSLSNDPWSEIRALLKEQNERLRIENSLLKQLLLEGDKGTGTGTNVDNFINDDKRNQSIKNELRLNGRKVKGRLFFTPRRELSSIVESIILSMSGIEPASTNCKVELGLRNASTVIESRAATQLGENVKVLAYVSIFYLPLGYCAALWSINRDFNLVAFALVTALLALGTYALVLNLSNIVFLIRKAYRKLPAPNCMKDDPHEQWANLGSAFSGFMPERHGDQPSEWTVLLYAVLMVTEKMEF